MDELTTLLHAACMIDPDSCHRFDYADGSFAMAGRITLEPTGDDQRSVTVYRPDDARVSLVTIAPPKSLLPVSALATIGRAPELTLYPNWRAGSLGPCPRSLS